LGWEENDLEVAIEIAVSHSWTIVDAIQLASILLLNGNWWRALKYMIFRIIFFNKIKEITV